MKRLLTVIQSICLIYIFYFNYAGAQNEIKIWREFVEILKKDSITPEHIHPLSAVPKEMVMEILKGFRNNAIWEEWEVEPEILRNNNLLNFIIPLKGKYGTLMNYCFMFLVENDRWYFRHIETIFIRLDKISSLPVSVFPDVSESQKIWAREEIYWSEQIRLFNFLTREKGKDFAFDWIKKGIGNGIGYLVGAESWVPFVSPAKAFILYLCWEQANLRGNKVTLEKLDDNEAIVKIVPTYFALYTTTSHLKKQISFDDYIKIFEIIWQERANCAGWKLKIDGEGVIVIFHFTK
jgi:hypothetical protein